VPKKTSYRSETNPTKREDARANEAYEKLKELTRSSSGMKRGGAAQAPGKDAALHKALEIIHHLLTRR
jgi:hypothetical protein